MENRQQPRHFTRVQVVEIDIWDHRAGYVALAREAQHLLLQLDQAAAFEAQFPQAARAVEQVEVLQTREGRPGAVQPVTGFEQRLVEGAAVVGDQYAAGFEEPRKGIEDARFLAIVAHEKLADTETLSRNAAHAH